MGIIISSFPGCGKTYLMNTHRDKAKMLNANELADKDQGDEYSYDLYVDNIMDVVDDYDIVFIPIDEKLLEIFNERKIDYDIFYPAKDRRKEFLENMVRKRAPRNDIMTLDRDFDKWVDGIEDMEFENCYKHKLEQLGQFIGNYPAIMQYINSVEEQNKKNKQAKKVEDVAPSAENNDEEE